MRRNFDTNRVFRECLGSALVDATRKHPSLRRSTIVSMQPKAEVESSNAGGSISELIRPVIASLLGRACVGETQPRTSDFAGFVPRC